MATTRRAARALMAASSFLRVPWVVSLAVKATINGRLRPQNSYYTRNAASIATTCSRRTNAFISTTSCDSRYIATGTASKKRASPVRSAHREMSSSDSAVVLDVDVDVSQKAEDGGVVDVDVVAHEVLSREAWTARAEAHRQRVRALTNGSVHHDSNDPIFNFLFEYYHFKPRMLLQWTPGIDTYLLDADPSLKGSPLPLKAWEPGPGRGGRYSALALDAKRRTTIQWVRDLVAETSRRAPVFHCFGLHEWAMLYRPPGVERDARSVHQELPLRVSQEQINEMVEGKGGSMGCTHFDAFRFFTPEAKPLNSVQLEREGQKAHDQPGCIHANMDMFKWALRLWPLLPSEQLVDALELAVDCRMLDMRASPYDLTAHGKAPDNAVGKGGGKVGGLPPDSWDPTPVRIETEEGRKEYQQAQWELYNRSMPVRRALLRHIDRLLEVWKE